METRMTAGYPVGKEVFEDTVHKYLVEKLINQLTADVRTLVDKIEELNKNGGISTSADQWVYIDLQNMKIVPHVNMIEKNSVYTNEVDFDHYKYSTVRSYQGVMPTFTELCRFKKQLEEKFGGSDWVICRDDRPFVVTTKNKVCYSDIATYGNPSCIEAKSRNHVVSMIPIVRLQPRIGTYVPRAALLMLIHHNIRPAQFEQTMFERFRALCAIDAEEPQVRDAQFEFHSRYVNYTGNKIEISVHKMANDILDKNKKYVDLLVGLGIAAVKAAMKWADDKQIERMDDVDIKDKLLNCEKIRADIEPYEERLLTDPNRGHWDLWSDDMAGAYTMQMENEYVARDPRVDIRENGVIAIDFGTKSTVVVFQNDIEQSLPMAIGDGKLSKGADAKRYENPTVMHFVNWDEFKQAYDMQAGRPQTVWEDLTISHTAVSQFNDSKSEAYYEYLQQIKQWAGERKKAFRIKTGDGRSIELPAFLDIKEGELNPIELYAYYIGLYINNMRNGIFLDYYLSFPVTYEVKVREKMVQSFERGLKKSLPTCILNDAEIMSRFRVHGDISEPAAYAACALQEYGFDPSDDEEVHYGIFDFGGGTTDFDFGIWKESSKSRYDYALENFGASGDMYLGGENLLEILAFEIFKDNADDMRKHGFTFSMAPTCKPFMGWESVVSDSQEAEKNMRNMMEKLRPYWEIDELPVPSEETEKSSKSAMNETFLAKYLGEIEIEMRTRRMFETVEDKIDDWSDRIMDLQYETVADRQKNINKLYSEMCTFVNKNEVMIDTYAFTELGNKEPEEAGDDIDEDDEIELKVDLEDKDGQPSRNYSITVSRKKIYKFFEERIRSGVKSFFAALMSSYQRSGSRNSGGKIMILLAGNSCKSPFVKAVFEQEIAEEEKRIRKNAPADEQARLHFELFPPLGTEAAYKKMEERGIVFDRNDPEKPTGKTGVAFGLIQCRNGGAIEMISNKKQQKMSDREIPFQFYLGQRKKKKFVPFHAENDVTRYIGKPDYHKWYKFIEADEDTFDLYYTTLPECIQGNLVVDNNAKVQRLRCQIAEVNEDAAVYIRAKDPHTIEYVVSADDDVENHKLGQIYTKELSKA